MSQPLSAKTKLLNSLRQILTAPIFEPGLLAYSSGLKLGSLPSRLIPNHYQYPKPSRRSVTRHGLRYELDIADIVDWAIYFDFAEPHSNALFDLAKPGDIVVDVGANIGHMAMTFARRCGPQGHVFSFEPDPLNFERLARNIALNAIPNITQEKLALGERSERLSLFRVNPRNPGMNRILPKTHTQKDEFVEIQVTRLDDYLAEKKAERFNLLKIDVEGYEMSVLKGAEKSIERWHPKIYIEVSDANLRVHGFSAIDLLQWLEDRGYQIQLADTDQRLDLDKIEPGFFRDVICFPR